MATETAKLIISLIDKVTGPARSISRQMTRLTRAAEANSRQLNAMRGRMMASVAAGYALYRALSAPVGAALEFESAMADVRKVVDFETPEAFSKMSSDIIEMSIRIPMAAKAISEIVAAAGQAGMVGGELLEFAEMAAKVGVAFDMSAGETGQSLAKIKTALGLTVAETSALADAMNQLSNTSASQAPLLLNYMKRVGSIGEQYGFTAEQTLAVGSAMIAAGNDAAVSATSFRNVGKALSRGASATTRQSAAFKSLGLDAVQIAKDLQDNAVGTLNDVLERIRALPKEVQASTISDLFGDEARALAPLIKNSKLLVEALETVAEKTNYLGSAQKEFEARAATTANSLQLLKNRFTGLGITIGNALLPHINSFVDAISPMIAAMTEFASANPKITTSIIALAAGLVGLSIATTVARFAFLFLKGGVLSAALAVTKAVGVFAAGFGKIGAAASSLTRIATGLGFSSSLSMIGASFTALGTTITAALGGVAGIIAGITWPVWVLIAAVAALGLAVRHYWVPITEFVKGFASTIAEGIGNAVDAIVGFGATLATETGKWLKTQAIDIGKLLGFDEATVKATIDAVVNTIKSSVDSIIATVKSIGTSVGNWFSELFSIKQYSDEEKAEFRSAGEAFAQAILDGMAALPGLIVDLFTGLGAKIVAEIGAIDFSSMLPDWVRNFLGYDQAKPASPANDNKAPDLGSLYQGVGYDMSTYVNEMQAGSKKAVKIADKTGQDIAEGLDVTVLPIIDTSSIDAANAKVNNLSNGIRNLPGVRTTNKLGLAGSRAAGGPVNAGGLYLVGEEGPELVRFGASGMVHSAQETALMLSPNFPVSPPASAFQSIPPQTIAAAGGGRPTSIVQHINVGDVIVSNPTNAAPKEIARSVGDEVGKRVRSQFSDGGF